MTSWFKNRNKTFGTKQSAVVDWNSLKLFPDEDKMDIEDFLLIAGTYVEKAKYASGYLNDNKKYYIKEAEYWIKKSEETISDKKTIHNTPGHK